MTILGVTASSILKSNAVFDSIASIDGTGTSNTITFSSIPSTYQHLQLRWFMKGTRSAIPGGDQGLYFYFNSGNSQYFSTYLNATPTTRSYGYYGPANANIQSIYGAPNSRNDSTYPGVGILDIYNYASTGQTKQCKLVVGSSNGYAYVGANWNDTSAITQIVINGNNTDNIDNLSRFSLYGIKG